MTDQNNSPRIAALQELEAALERHRRAQAGRRAPRADRAEPPVERRQFGLRQPGWRLPFNPWFMFDRRHPVVRQAHASASSAAVAVVLVVGGALWWRLASGPICSISRRPGSPPRSSRTSAAATASRSAAPSSSATSNGRTALRLRDIVVRDAGGALVASAPKAEVGIAGTSLLMGSPRAESFRLVDANLAFRIEEDGRVNVFAGGERPLAHASRRSAPSQPRTRRPHAVARLFAAGRSRSAASRPIVAALLAWIDGLGGLGRDGKSLDVDRLRRQGPDRDRHQQRQPHGDDRRDGQEWSFKQLTMSLIRPSVGRRRR